MHYCLANDLPTLVWAANLADLELHTSLSRKNNIERPTMMVFDLDPGAPADIVQCCQIGIWLRELLGGIKLKGLSRSLAQRLEREHPYRVKSNMSKAVRKGKVFVDWSQNDEHKTTICVYSLRAKEEPTASTPVTWSEVENCLKKKRAKF